MHKAVCGADLPARGQHGRWGKGNIPENPLLIIQVALPMGVHGLNPPSPGEGGGLCLPLISHVWGMLQHGLVPRDSPGGHH